MAKTLLGICLTRAAFKISDYEIVCLFATEGTPRRLVIFFQGDIEIEAQAITANKKPMFRLSFKILNF